MLSVSVSDQSVPVQPALVTHVQVKPVAPFPGSQHMLLLAYYRVVFKQMIFV